MHRSVTEALKTQYARSIQSIQLAMQVRSTEPNNDKAHVDAYGFPLPPCIIMERGESLDIWAARAQPDRSQAFTVRPYHRLEFVGSVSF